MKKKRLKKIIKRLRSDVKYLEDEILVSDQDVWGAEVISNECCAAIKRVLGLKAWPNTEGHHKKLIKLLEAEFEKLRQKKGPEILSKMVEGQYGS